MSLPFANPAPKKGFDFYFCPQRQRHVITRDGIDTKLEIVKAEDAQRACDRFNLGMSYRFVLVIQRTPQVSLN
jgi:hypothetical protein